MAHTLRRDTIAPAEPFVIDIPQTTLDDLHDRLRRTRWLDANGDGWATGTNAHYLRELVGYWKTAFDWRAQERAINRLPQFRADIDGVAVHFVHERGKGDRPLPLILTHGYPDSFVRFLKVIPLLTDPAAHGGDPADAFDVVVPSIPGYGFSGRPPRHGFTFQIGSLWYPGIRAIRRTRRRLGHDDHRAARARSRRRGRRHPPDRRAVLAPFSAAQGSIA